LNINRKSHLSFHWWWPYGQGHMLSLHMSVAGRTLLEQDRHMKCIENEKPRTWARAFDAKCRSVCLRLWANKSWPLSITKLSCPHNFQYDLIWPLYPRPWVGIKTAVVTTILNWMTSKKLLSCSFEIRKNVADGQMDGRTGQKHICLQPVGRRHNNRKPHLRSPVAGYIKFYLDP